MSSPPWLIIGISGVTCGGKSSLAKALQTYLSNPENANSLSDNVRVQSVHMLQQDEYFYPESSDNHTWLDHLNHINWEILSALNMPKMCMDIRQILGASCELYVRPEPVLPTLLSSEPSTPHRIEINVLIIEGFTIFNHPTIMAMCHLKFHLHLPYEKCFARRSARVYVPADVIGYFESCVWPMYMMHFNQYRDRNDVIVLNAEISTEKCFHFLMRCMRDEL